MKATAYYMILSGIWLSPHLGETFGLTYGVVLGLVSMYLHFKGNEDKV